MNYSIGWNLSNTVLKGTEKYPLQIQIYHLGKQFRIGVKIYLSKLEYKEITSQRVVRNGELKKIKKQMEDYHAKAADILDNMVTISKDDFKALFFGETNISKPASTKFLKDLFNDLMSDYKAAGKDVKTYDSAIKSFIAFKGTLILFEQTDEKWIKEYRQWMLGRGRSAETAKLYLRCLKTLWNRQIKDRKVHAKYYPFKDISIGSKLKTKKALMPEDIQKLRTYIPVTEAEQKAIDFWFFCYLCNGMNPSDALRLKVKNLKGDIITFVRQKTKHNENPPVITVSLHSEAKRIIEKYTYGLHEPEWYIFPDLVGCRNEEMIKDKITSFKNYQNKRLRRIGEKLHLDQKPVLGVSRHSFATRLKLNGFAAEAGELLGHTNPDTTSHYMASLPVNRIKSITDSLLDD